MRMKKLFALGLCLLLFALVLSFVPEKPVIDDDVGITCVIADQSQNHVYFIADFARIGESDYSCTQELLRLQSNEANYINSHSQNICRIDNGCPIWQRSSDNITSKLGAINISNQFQGVITRLDIGEILNKQNII